MGALVEKIHTVENRARAVAKKHRCNLYYSVNGVAFGGIGGLNFKKEPSHDKYKRSYNPAGWLPKKNMPENKALAWEIEQLPTISKLELNATVGFKDKGFKTIGLAYNHKTHFGFTVGDDWDYVPHKDAKEVTVTAYRKTFNIKKNG